jgi:hypothetical protein
MKFVAQSLIAVVLFSSSTAPQAYGLEYSDPYYFECSISGAVDKVDVVNFTVNFLNFLSSKSQKTKTQKLEYKKLKVEEKKLRDSLSVYTSDVKCESLRVDQWLLIREDRLDALKTAEEYIVKMMQKYPFTSIQCFKNGIPKEVNGINPVCPKGFKKI